MTGTERRFSSCLTYCNSWMPSTSGMQTSVRTRLKVPGELERRSSIASAPFSAVVTAVVVGNGLDLGGNSQQENGRQEQIERSSSQRKIEEKKEAKSCDQQNRVNSTHLYNHSDEADLRPLFYSSARHPQAGHGRPRATGRALLGISSPEQIGLLGHLLS